MILLGWICIGNLDGKVERIYVNFIFFLNDLDNVSSFVCWYWDIEEFIDLKMYIVNLDEKFVMDVVVNLLIFVDGYYIVGMF